MPRWPIGLVSYLVNIRSYADGSVQLGPSHRPDHYEYHRGRYRIRSGPYQPHPFAGGFHPIFRSHRIKRYVPNS